MERDQITEAQLMKIALEMVAAGSLTVIYGTEPFDNARKAFVSALHGFVDQANENAKAGALGYYVEKEESKPLKFCTDAAALEIPECLKKFRSQM